jgi:mono/diheme cytochrome c family protein
MSLARAGILLAAVAAAGAALAASADPYGGDIAGPAHGVFDAGRAWRNYALNCQGCHRREGDGDGQTAPALAGHLAVFTRLPGGRDYLGRVPGVASAPLPDDQVAELLNWALWRFDPTHVAKDFKPYTAEEIGRLRRQPLRTEAEKVRAALLASANR